MPEILIIGSASLDTLHIKGQPVSSPGGAGMYTAMAAKRSGANVAMFGPRPDPMPDILRPVDERCDRWFGPSVTQEELPRFEIKHEGDKAVYLDFFIRAELRLDPGDLPADLLKFDGLHIIPLGDPEHQHKFVRECRKRGARYISTGTFIKDVKENPDVVRTTMDASDVFFMNEEEAVCFFGSLDTAKTSPGKLLFITLGRKGALVIQGDYQTHVPAYPAEILDPTGAGDTFCGAALANLLRGIHPVMAARMATILAAQEIENIGPAALLWDAPPPSMQLDDRVEINPLQVEEIARIIKYLPEAGPFDFTSDDLPPAGHPLALEYFFISTLQQFSFWEDRDRKYDYPLIASIDGALLKGSSYLYRSYLRPLDSDPDFYSPSRQAELTEEELLAVYRADDGTDPIPAFDLHLQQARQYGQDMLSMGITARDAVARANQSDTPLKTFLMLLDHIGGYKEDPTRKKSMLLALCLNQRPEAFLRFGKDEVPTPVVDYHAMRTCLRTGMINVLDKSFETKLADRQLISREEEWSVRYATYKIQENVALISGKAIGAVDWFFFNYMRSHCPEMSEPVCRECAINPVCAHRKDLFQPVIRTTFY